MAKFRPRLLTAATVLVTLALLISAATAHATLVRVEVPHANVFQGNVTPFVGALKDQNGVSHSTTTPTALGALVTASRTKPFALGLTWSDSFGGGWAGFFINSVAGVTPPPTAFWAVKVGQKLTDVGAGAVAVTPSSNVLVYYTTFDPTTFATQETLGVSASKTTVKAGTSVTITVRAFNDAGQGSRGAGASVWINGVATHANSKGQVSFRPGAAGRFSVRATAPNEIESQTLWIRATAS